eukprot:gene1607-3102_t
MSEKQTIRMRRTFKTYVGYRPSPSLFPLAKCHKNARIDRNHPSTFNHTFLLNCCQGTNYDNALNNCDDQGAQKLSSGGNVNVILKYATNLPNMDSFALSSQVSDPYVEFIVGKNVRVKSSVVRDELNPNWHEEVVRLGLLGSATEIRVAIWDRDIGLEFSDDLLVQTKVRVPFCSTFNASISRIDCGEPYGCSSDDSNWQMPDRQLCTEDGEINFNPSVPCSSPGSTCLYLEFQIVPFTMQVETASPRIYSKTPLLSVASDSNSNAPWIQQKLFGYPFISKSTRLDFKGATDSQFVKGALMFRLTPDDRNLGKENSPYFYASVNFPSYIYVCRWEADNLNGIPPWMHTSFSNANISATRIKLQSGDEYFGCFYLETEGTIKNKYGGIESGIISFRTNTIANQDNLANNNMYIILAIPRVIVHQYEVVVIDYTNGMMLINFVENGIVFFWFFILIAHFIKKIHFRLDRIMGFLTTRVFTGHDKTLVALLFMHETDSPNNIVFRSHLYHATNIINFFLFLPFLLLIGWGFSCAASVKPRAIGYAIVFLGSSAVFLWFSLSLWERQKWMMSPTALLSLVMSVMLCLIFFISVIFADPAVTEYGYKLDFTALSLVFATINSIPLLLLIFRRDKTFRINLNIVVEKMTEAVYNIKNIAVPTDDRRKGKVTANKAIHALLDSCYTINPNVPLFRYATVLRDASKDSSTNPEVDRFIYRTASFVLFVFLMIALSRTDHPSLAFLHCLAFMLLDGIHASISSGDVRWSPGYHIFLLVAGRLAIASSSGRFWLINYSVAFLVYSWSLVREIVDSVLPTLTKRQAGEAVFTGKDINSISNPDMSGSAHFSLGCLVFFYVSLVLVAAFSSNSEALPLPSVDIAGTSWPMYALGLISFLVVVVGGIGMATWRAFYLEKNGLLRGWARDTFLFRENIKLPIVLAALLELSIISSGLLIFAATGSSAILTLSIFIPLIALCFSYAAKIWVANDYDLVKWPPLDNGNGGPKDDAPSDLEVAFNMIENLFGEDEGPNDNDNDDDKSTTSNVTGTKEMRTIKNFKLPTMQATGNKIDGPIKMPPLPLKSVLRRKRELMGIKAHASVVKDLHGREDGDPDKFGDGDVLDINDPWAQFEQSDMCEHVTDMAAVTTSAATAVAVARSGREERRGFLESKYAVAFTRLLLQNPVGRCLKHSVASCFRQIQKTTRRHDKISPRVETAPAANIELKIDNDNDNNNKIDENKRKSSVVPISTTGEENDIEQGKDIEKDIKTTTNDADGDEQQALDVTEENIVDIQKMSFWHAVIGGYLTRSESIALSSWFMGLFLIMIMGIVLHKTVAPPWIGPTIWVAMWTFICTIVPVIKYFNVYKVDYEMKLLGYFVLLLHFLYCISFFGSQLNADLGVVGSLWILDYFIYFPILIYLFIELYKWRDNNWIITNLDQDGDGNVTWREYIVFFKAYPIILSLLIILNWQFYVWIDYTVGIVFTLFLLVGVFGYKFARDWSASNFFLSPRFQLIGEILIRFILVITFLISLFQEEIPLFALSVFFFTLMFRCLLHIIARLITIDVDSIVYFSPYMMPVYTYDRRNNDVVDETAVTKQVFIAFISGILWGAWIAIFSYPVWVGTFVACLFLLAVASTVSAAISVVPLQLGHFAAMLNVSSIRDAANAAAEKFHERQSPLSIEINDWDGLDEPLDSPLDKVSKRRTAIECATDIIEDVRSLKYVKHSGVAMSTRALIVKDTSKEEKSWYVRYWSTFLSTMKVLFEMIPFNRMNGWKVHNEALFSDSDALAEALIAGRGPFGFIGIQGMWYKLFKSAKENPRMKFLRQPWLNIYDEMGNYTDAIKLSESLNTRGILSRLTAVDHSLDANAHEESRCAIHFLLMLLVSGDSQLQREQILFQKFLRENRFRLASNGISPPADIFTSSSFASIDIALVACWLSRLTAEERERFHQLKATFSDEQAKRDQIIDDEDYQLGVEARTLEAMRLPREKLMADKLRRDFARSLSERVKAFVATLSQDEKERFDEVQEEWTSNADVTVESKDQEMYDKFRTAVMNHKDEVTEYARQVIAEIEAAQRDCRIGEFGRMYQFVDPDFIPGDQSLGDCAAKGSLLGWRCANGIREGIQLFDGGTDPDDVEIGVFNDSWLLSAVSMIAAAGGVGDGGVDEQVLNLFVGHYGIDGEVTYHTEVGCFGLRIYKQGIWNPIVVDDLFPMLKQDKWTNGNRGIACAHSKECRELWVPLIEKAYAKYYGSYSSLEKGFVHHALEDLTGAESQCLFLSNASRGPGKKALWDTLMRYRKNGFILGAGTGAAEQADKEILEMGIIFNAAYTIYEVREVDEHRLLKLRNPPGDHDEWKGDWSDKSTLWTTRLKRKLGWTDADDNTFWISFDDFCNVFRCLYICKWHNPDKWWECKMSGQWKQINNSAAVAPPLSADQTSSVAPLGADTSGGLPSRHNPGCRLENNPHYVLKVHRPSELRITLSQTDSRGVARGEPLPVAIYVCRNDHEATPKRMRFLNRHNVVCYTGAPCKERTQHLYTNLRPGSYIVLVGAYTAGMEGIFTLGIQSDQKVDLTQIWPQRWLVNGKMVEGAREEKEQKVVDLGAVFKNKMDDLVRKVEGSQADDDDDEETRKQQEEMDEEMGLPKNPERANSVAQKSARSNSVAAKSERANSIAQQSESRSSSIKPKSQVE